MCDKCQQELDFFSNPFATMDSMRNRMEAMHRNFVSLTSLIVSIILYASSDCMQGVF